MIASLFEFISFHSFVIATSQPRWSTDRLQTATQFRNFSRAVTRSQISTFCRCSLFSFHQQLLLLYRLQSCNYGPLHKSNYSMVLNV